MLTILRALAETLAAQVLHCLRECIVAGKVQHREVFCHHLCFQVLLRTLVASLTGSLTLPIIGPSVLIAYAIKRKHLITPHPSSYILRRVFVNQQNEHPVAAEPQPVQL